MNELGSIDNLEFEFQTEVDVIEDIEEYQTYPGIITPLLRIIVMVGFVMALRDTMLYEYNPEKLNFFLHFGAASLVWFNYLPLLAIIALQISALWREKFLIGVTYSVDTFAYAILMHLLWPSRSQQYFLLAVKQVNTHSFIHFSSTIINYFMTQENCEDELEELNQAANHLNHSQYIGDDVSESETSEPENTDLVVI